MPSHTVQIVSSRQLWGKHAGTTRQHACNFKKREINVLAVCCRYLRNRELVLGTYLVLSAAVTAYSSYRDTLQLESQSALASLVWFSRAHSAEPLMLKSIIFAVRPLHILCLPLSLAAYLSVRGYQRTLTSTILTVFQVFFEVVPAVQARKVSVAPVHPIISMGLQ